MSRIVFASRRPIVCPIADSRTVRRQSAMTRDTSTSPLLSLGCTSTRRVEPPRGSEVMGNTVAYGNSDKRSDRTTTAGRALSFGKRTITIAPRWMAGASTAIRRCLAPTSQTQPPWRPRQASSLPGYHTLPSSGRETPHRRRLVYPASGGVWVYRAQGWCGGGRETKTIPRFRRGLGIATRQPGADPAPVGQPSSAWDARGRTWFPPASIRDFPRPGGIVIVVVLSMPCSAHIFRSASCLLCGS